MARSVRFVVVFIATVLAMAGCATLHPDFESPTVSVSAIRPLASESIMPRFEIDLHIINPNRSPLKLQGIAYSLSLEKYKILTGVANDLPIIDGYGEGDVTLTAATNLMSSIRFFADLVNTHKDAIAYVLEAKLDLGGLQPALRIHEEGEIDLTEATR
ncbi:LEA type 2 family protein [Desulfosarcina ovata]|uniref:Water stress and hypersensitive response domain-containing protein n=1 Tax=Desulfosarcina ovata subsp. ovata TaxID=2752305 RepID=A0A5K8AGS7_9BACT|nr:LEA type 2 family protein [Desulfosarcina ovata]BBO91060.1 hypothetical protein DSCOOX_42400 [Desulfosarcina ovata subsp. ovata]